MVKKDPFKDKPKPPNREQIIADLASASENDVVFMQQFTADVTSSTPSKEDLLEQSNVSSGPNTRQNDHTERDSVKINQTYEQVTKLIQLHTELSKEPKILDEKYKHLEKLGQEVELSISELKSAAESVVTKTKKK